MRGALFTTIIFAVLWNCFVPTLCAPLQGFFYPSSTQLFYYAINENVLYPYYTLPAGQNSIESVAVDINGNLTQGVPKVYFSVNSSGSIMRCNLLDTCSGLETVYQYSSGQNFAGISLDFQDGRIYWVDGSSVVRVNSDGSGFQTVLSSLAYPSKISTSSGQLYVTLSSKNGNVNGDGVGKSSVDGVGYATILASSLKNAHGIYADSASSTLYITDSGKDTGGGGSEKIISSDWNGNQVVTLVTGGMQTPDAIQLYGNSTLYWIDSTLQTINKYDLTTTARSTVFTFGSAGGVDLALYEADIPLNVTLPPSPSPTPSATPSRTPSPSASVTPSGSSSPSATPSSSSSTLPSASPSSLPSNSPASSASNSPSAPQPSDGTSTGNSGNSTTTNSGTHKNSNVPLMVAAVVLPTVCLLGTAVCLAVRTAKKKSNNKRQPDNMSPPPDVENSGSNIPSDVFPPPPPPEQPGLNQTRHEYVDLGLHSSRNSLALGHRTVSVMSNSSSDSDENNTFRKRGLTTRGNPKSLNSYEIDFDEISLGKELGRGAYGIVYLGEYRHQKVAVKKLLKSDLTLDQIEEFKEEGILMCSLKPHKNVVTTLGLCVGKELCIVTEFMPMGSLQSYLQLAKLETKRIITIGMDIAAGMAHLSREGIVHRDLAARNLLLTENLDVKISDFGMARVLESKEESSGKTASTTGPLKWMAPESITDGEYSTKSDVWAFGITMVEILTRQQPYPDMSGVNVCVQVVGGMTHPIPPECPEELGALMLACWAKKPEERPSFDEIFKALHDMVK